MKHRIVVIGCGYVGFALAKRLVELGHDVLGTTTTPDRVHEIAAIGVRPVVLDGSDRGALYAALRDRDAVYLTVAPRTRGSDYRSVYLATARTLIPVALDTGVSRIIYTSSTRVYGVDDGRPVDEESPSLPADEQGRILRQTEELLLSGGGGAHRIPPAVSVVRLAGIYGPDRDPALRIHALAGTQRDDGDAYVNLVHLADIVPALVALLPLSHHGVLNLSDDEPTTRREFYDRVLSRAGLPPIRWVAPSGCASRGKRVRNDRIKTLLNLTLRHPTHLPPT